MLVSILDDFSINCLSFSFFQAVDLDAGNNSNIAYKLIHEKSGNIFTVEKSTGWVRSAQSFTGKVGQSYNLKVLAQDNGGIQPNFNDTTLVKVRKQADGYFKD